MNSLTDHFKRARPPFPSARRRFDLVAVSAASDGEWLGVQDLLDSLATYLECGYEVVFADDATVDGTYERLLNAGCWVVRNPQKLYPADLHLTLRRAFVEAHRLFESPIFLKIDPDALVIGPGLLQALQSAFSIDPKTGLLGTYHLDWNGEPRDLSYWQDRMTRRRKDLGKPYDLALSYGYKTGDGVQGGAYALAGACLEAIIRQGWFHGKAGYRPSHAKGHRIAEDSLITLLTYAAGFKAQDFGDPEQPFGIWGVGLPMSPEKLIQQNRLVTHAIKYNDEVSLQTRNFFRLRREALRSGRSSRTPNQAF